MKTYRQLWNKLANYDNLELAYNNARKGKTTNPKIIKFEKHLRLNLCILLRELRTQTYTPKPIKKFVLRDPKTRTISVSNFRDRIIHHALINILQPIFEPRFIFDSYASRKGKGTLSALNRFDKFKLKTSKNIKETCFVLKADIKHYFQTVDHQILINIISKKVKDENIIWLIQAILKNYEPENNGAGMPLGNWTSQFFANIYLNELDQYIKHKLQAKYYIRYVDDFIIVHNSKSKLKQYENKIDEFIVTNLKLKLHPDKCKIITLKNGISFLGFRVFTQYKIPRKRNIRKIRNKLKQMINDYKQGRIEKEDVFNSLNGWSAYAMHADTYKLRKRLKKEVIIKISEND